MVLRRWYPLSEIRRIEENASGFRRAFGAGRPLYGPVSNGALPLDVEEEDDSIIVRASLPGVRPEDIEVTTEDGVLIIKAGSEADSEVNEDAFLIHERRNGSLRRSLRLPDAVDVEGAESSYEHGVLTVSFPKQEARKPRRLEVKVKS
jgi:HSP20 family protein